MTQDLVATGCISEKVLKGIKSVFPDKKILVKNGAFRVLSVSDSETQNLPLEVLAKEKIDAKWVPSDFSISRFKIMTLDMDSTLVANEVIDDLATYCGRGDEVKIMTHRVLETGLDFKGSLAARVECLKGAKEDIIKLTAQNLRLNPGAYEWVKFAMVHGVKVYVVSAGFKEIAKQCAKMLGLTGTISNDLVIEDGKLTGEVVGPAEGEVLDAPGKRRTLEVLAMLEGVTLKECIAGGDGSNDSQMVAAAGFGYAYHGKPIVEKNADFCVRFAGHEAVMNLFTEAWSEASELGK